jgi:hypothetical protein
VLALARFADAAKTQAVARLPDERRGATLLAFIRALEASAQDDVLDLFDLLVARMFVDAVRKGREARLRSLRDLDAAALTLSKACDLDSRTGFRHREWQKCGRLIKPGRKCGAKL